MGAHPAQNGDLKAAQASEADHIHIVNETESAEQPASTTHNQQGAADRTPPVADGDKREEADVSSSPADPPEEPSPAAPLEVGGDPASISSSFFF